MSSFKHRIIVTMSTKNDYLRFLQPYYILNILLIVVYPVTRLIFSMQTKERDMFGYTKEDSILLTLCVILLVKYRKACTFDHFLTEFFWLGKLAECSLYFFVDFQVCMWYLLACTVIYLFCRQPKYDGPTNMIHIKNEQQFEDLVINDRPYQSDEEDSDSEETTKKKNKNKNKQNPPPSSKGPQTPGDQNIWLVEFYANWAETCVYTKPLWAEWSVRYQTKRFHFAEVDVAALRDLALKYDVNTTIMSRQLPTLILFEDGQEIMRFPPIDEKTGKAGRVLKYNKKELAKYFELDKRWLLARFK